MVTLGVAHWLHILHTLVVTLVLARSLLQDLLAGFNCFAILSQDYLSPLDGIIDRLPNVTPLLSFVFKKLDPE